MQYEEIYKVVETWFEHLQASEYPEDLLTEWADSAVPVYNTDIYNEWGNLPPEALDEWQGAGLNKSSSTIIDLMRIDLYLHLEGLYNRAYSELLTLKEGN